jgi:hypothetical protein
VRIFSGEKFLVALRAFLICVSFFDNKAERKYIFIEQKNYKQIRTGVQNGGVLWN